MPVVPGGIGLFGRGGTLEHLDIAEQLRYPGGVVQLRYHRAGDPVILPRVRDPRSITIRRGGTLSDGDRRLLELVLEDERLRNHICWFMFDC